MSFCWKPIREELRNVLIVSVICACVNGPRYAIQSIQSSLNLEDGMGVTMLACIYGGIVIINVFSPLILRTITLKTVVLLYICGVFLYIVANFYPLWATVIPACVLLGTSAGIYWPGIYEHISQRAIRHSSVSKDSLNTITSKFMGVVVTFYIFSNVISNIISSVIFQRKTNQRIAEESNTTTCGVDYCPSKTPRNVTFSLEKPAEYTTLYIFLGVCICSVTVAAIVTLVMFKDIPREPKTLRKTDSRQIKSEILKNVTLVIRNIKLFILLPFIISSTFVVSFLYADFTKGYITCVIGIGMVGYIMMAYSLSTFISSFISSRIIQYTGRISQVVFFEVLYMALILTLYWWKPTKSDMVLYFVFSILCGSGDTIFWTQGIALVAEIFPENKKEAFANLTIWRGIGFSLSCALSNIMCVRYKLCLAGTLLSIGAICYIYIEMCIRNEKKLEVTKNVLISITDKFSESGTLAKPDTTIELIK